MKVKEKVYEILKDLSCMEAVNDNDSLLEDLPLDSLAMVTLLVELEDALSVPLDDNSRGCCSACRKVRRRSKYETLEFYTDEDGRASDTNSLRKRL